MAPAAAAATYTVTGKIHTPVGPNQLANDVPVKHIRVLVMDDDALFDDVAGQGYTNGTGDFSVTFVDEFEAPDVYVDVEYVGTAVDGRFIEVRRTWNVGSPVKDVNVQGFVHQNIDPGTLSLGVLRLTDTRANIITQIGDAFRTLKSFSSAWVMMDDAKIEGRTTNGASYVNGDGSHMSIAMEDYDDPNAPNRPSAAFSDLHHETFHWIAYRAYGNRWPTPTCSMPNGHAANSQSCEGFAMAEGSAQWFGSTSAPPDQKTPRPPTNVWRGLDGTGLDNSGEIVEGAYENTFDQVNDPSGVLQVLLTDAPDSIREFRDAYAIDKGWSSTAMTTFFDVASNNGIVYTSGRLSGFAESDPPMAAPPSPGNFKVLSGISFLRGKIKPAVQPLTQADLRLASTNSLVAPGMKDLGYKTATNGLQDVVGGFTYTGPVAFNTDLEWDTSLRTDGDYDLIVRVTSTNGWVDTFLPDFTGDFTLRINTFEKWLKTQGTWYNQDRLPNNDDEGKVILDNTPPVVKDFKP